MPNACLPPSPPARRASPAHRGFEWLLSLIAVLVLTLCAHAASAQPPSGPGEAAQTVLDTARQRLTQLQQRADGQESTATLLRDRDEALAVLESLNRYIETQQPVLENHKAKLGGLGEAPADAPEAPALAEQRADLSDELSIIETQLRMARLLALEADQVLDQITAKRRARFHAELGMRTRSVLSASFWQQLQLNQAIDARRAGQTLGHIEQRVQATPAWIWLAVAAAVAVILIAYRAARQLLHALTATRVPAGRLRRSLHAWSRIFLAVLAPLLILTVLSLGMTWRHPPTADAHGLLTGAIVLICFGSYVNSLGSSLLAAHAPTWRLAPLLDETAWDLRHFPLGAAALVILNGLAERAGEMFSLSLTSSILINLAIAGLTAALIARFLWRVRRLRRADGAAQAQPSDSWLARQLSRWMGVLQAAAGIALAFSVFCLLIGYVALGAFVLKQMIWSTVVILTSYLLSVTISDAAAAALGRPLDQPDRSTPSSASEQLVILGSGIGQVLVFLFAALLLVAPYGHSPTDIQQHLERLRGGLSIGEIQLKPMVLLQAAVTFGLGVLAVNAFKRWLAQRLLPATTLDRGIQASTTTLIGYVGYVIAMVLALASTGLGMERLTWIASALSIGIGFGLQAIVQNFVSGLILLAERPVKVGDWVSLGAGVEGDIRRINVRATEIQMGDRSTIIVPNSELITKAVRNVTHGGPLGRIQIQLTLPLDAPAETVREVMLQTMEAHPDVLDAPAPAVTLDDISAAALVFKGTAYVKSPRLASGIRSAVMFELLKRLRESGVALSSPSSMRIVNEEQALQKS